MRLEVHPAVEDGNRIKGQNRIHTRFPFQAADPRGALSLNPQDAATATKAAVMNVLEEAFWAMPAIAESAFAESE